METTSSMVKIDKTNEMVRIPRANITDLCEVCLLKVLGYLEVIDLANLVEANIVSNLGKRNGNKLQYQESIVKEFKIKVKMDGWKTKVYTDARSAPKDIKILRSFGREIESLMIYYRVNYKICDATKFVECQNRRYERALEDAIVDFCGKTLIAISFVECNEDTMKELDRPFRHVQSVEFYDGQLGSTLGQLKKWFPKMNDLCFTDTYVFDARCIHDHFPNLISLTVWNGERGGTEKGKMIFSNWNVEAFLEMNPQLEALSIRHDDVDELDSDGSNAIIVDWNLLTSISKNLKLEKLNLNLENFRFAREWPSTIAVDSLITLHVECSDCYCLNVIRITSANLTELKLTFDDTGVDYEAISTFVLCAAPKQLKLIANCQTFAVDNAHVITLITLLPQLQELSVECQWDDNVPDAFMNLLAYLLVNGSTELKHLIGVFDFDGYPTSQYSTMQEIFRIKITRNDFVKSRWSYKFHYSHVDGCSDTIEFEKNMQEK